MFAQHQSRSMASILALVTSLSGCAEWHTQNVSPQTVLEQKHPEQIRVVTTHYDTLTLVSPVVVGDTLFGQVQTSFPAPAGSVVGMGSAQPEPEPAPETMRQVSIPLKGVREIATESVDPTPIIGGALLGAALVAAIELIHWPCVGYCPNQ